MLSTTRLVKVNVSLTARAASARGFGTLLILGNSDVITAAEKYRNYTDINSVAADFGTEAEEYKAALLYFSQDPAPSSLMIGRWFDKDTPAVLRGAILTTAEQRMDRWSSIKNGAFIYNINGVDYPVDNIDLQNETNLNGVASKINEKINTNASIEYDGSRFTIKTNETGADTTIGYLKSPSEQINIQDLLGINQGTAVQTNGTDKINGSSQVPATSATLTGTTVENTQLNTIKAITDGSMSITIAGSKQDISAVDFSSATDMNNVAATLQAKITGVTVTYETNKFVIKTTSTGATATISNVTAGSTGTDIATPLGLVGGDIVNGADMVPAVPEQPATAGSLVGGIVLNVDEMKAIKNGNFKIAIDNAASVDIKELDFSNINTVNDIATAIGEKLDTANVSISEGKLKIESKTTGSNSTVGYGEGIELDQVDLSSMLKMTAETGLAPSNGAGAETIIDAVNKMCIATAEWYGLVTAVDSGISNDDVIEIAQLIEAQTDVTRIFGVTETDTRVLDAEYTDDLASRLHALNLNRSVCQYSQNKYAICSYLGRAFTVNFNGNMTCITLMYKQEPSVEAEDLTETQAQVLQNKRCNVFTKYNNDTSIIQYGVMCGDMYFDERHGSDWLQNYVQNNAWNVLYTTTTKIGQDDAGMNDIVSAVNDGMERARENGYIGAGTWNSSGFGQLKRGDYLTNGYYVYCPPMSTQSQADREERKAVPIQVAGKLLGAIHTIEVAITLNR